MGVLSGLVLATVAALAAALLQAHDKHDQALDVKTSAAPPARHSQIPGGTQRGDCPSVVADCAALEANGTRCDIMATIVSRNGCNLDQIDKLIRSSLADTRARRYHDVSTGYGVDGAKVTMLSPHGVYLVEDFLTSEEADQLVLAGGHDMERSVTDLAEFECCRNSSNAWLVGDPTLGLPHFVPTLPIVGEVQRKIHELVPKSGVIEVYEPLSITKYEPGDFYVRHIDDGQVDSWDGFRRTVTVLMYLNDIREDAGGATFFPDLDLRVKPKKGRAVIFFPTSLDHTVNAYSLHEAEETKQTRFVAQQWIRSAQLQNP